KEISISRESVVIRRPYRLRHPGGVLLERPLARDFPGAGPESIAVPARDVSVAELAVVPASEPEGFAGYGYADVDTDHARFEPFSGVPRHFAAGRVDRCGIPEGIFVLNDDGFIQRLDADDGEHRSEDFVTRRPVATFQAIDEGRSH